MANSPYPLMLVKLAKLGKLRLGKFEGGWTRMSSFAVSEGVQLGGPVVRLNRWCIRGYGDRRKVLVRDS